MNLDKINAIRYAVCGIGYLKVPEEEFLKDPMLDPFEVMGTGFLIGSGLVLTAAHVLDDLKEKLRKRPEPFEKMVQFGYPQADQWRVEYRSFREFEVNDRADWATIEVGPVGETVRPVLAVGRDYQLRIEEEIGMCGYAHGSILLRKGRTVDRFGPVLQRGHIAALSPYDGVRPQAMLLDVIAAPASSGSPVFLPSTGQVIGMLLKGQEGRTAALSVAIPFYREGDRFITTFSPVRPAEPTT